MRGLLIWLVRGYKRVISPILPPSCRFYPTCSTYMIDAIGRHGAIKGLLMGLSRILRCNPLSRGGIDYVPEHFSLRRNPDEAQREGRS